MKIAHIIIGLNKGGAELMLRRLVLAQKADQEMAPMIISLTDEGTLGAELKSQGIEISCLDLKSVFFVPLVFIKLIKILKKNQIEIVQTWMYHADLIGGLAAKLSGVKKIIWGIRTTKLDFGVSTSTRLISKINSKLSYFIPDKIICAANASLLEHVNRGYNKALMQVVPNGFELDRFHPEFNSSRDEIRLNLGISKEDIVIGSVGRFNPDKDFDNLFRASELLKSKNLHFLLIGKNLDAKNKDISLPKNSHHWHLLGEQANIGQLMAAMDIFVLHSRTEGFPNVLGEAMAMGLSCVSTDVGDASLMLGDCGVIVNKENSQALAKGIDELVDYTVEQRKELGLKARARVEAHYSMESVTQQFKNIYTDLLENRDRGSKCVD